MLQCVGPELQQLYHLLEVEYNPLQLCSRVQPLLEAVGAIEGCEQYVEPLKEVTLVRLVKQVTGNVEVSVCHEMFKFSLIDFSSLPEYSVGPTGPAGTFCHAH